jgi:hypothetical protein
MAVVGVGCVRSCGVTTLATGLAMVWPAGRRRLLVEADPAGGMLAAVAGLAPEPGLVSLAAAARRQGEPSLAFGHAQALADGTPVLCGPPGADRARSAIAMVSGLLGRLGELDADIFLDCGRLDPATPNAAVLERADLLLLACRPRLADLQGLATFLDGHELPLRPVLVLVGPGPYPAAEVTDALGTDVAGQVPWDPEAADAMGATPVSARQLTRTPLVRALRTLADELARRLRAGHAEQPQPAASPSGNGDAPSLEARR